ncbi:interferon-induced protein 35 [Callorhinchus milii]|uniref:interferon-induced protein 35 n=1 Tax=Callorhinchus milii TaxID=7868 RepID=UPI001C3F60E4|nr:interferon-induced protein 35 [Callorhinchus milii]XP_042199311.1 interferon-induced protein 35 [Callorhinchus milii]
MEESLEQQLSTVRQEIQQNKAHYQDVSKDKIDLEELKFELEKKTQEYTDRIQRLQKIIDTDQLEKDNQGAVFQKQLDKVELENTQLAEKQQALRDKLRKLEEERLGLEQQSKVSSSMPKRPLVFNGKTKEGKTCNVDFNVKPNIHYPVRGGCALVTFEDKEVAKTIVDKGEHVVEIEDCHVKIKALPIELPMLKQIEIQTCVCKERILVSEIPKLLADDQLLDKLELHFSRPRNSGGEVKSIDLLEDSGNVVIAFCEDGIAERLTKKEFHQVEFRGNSRDSKDKKMRLRVSPFINGELVDVKLSNAVCERSVLLTEIPDIMDPEELQDLLEIHFQKPSMDGGEVDTFMYLPQGQSAVARFNKDERQKEYKPNLLMDSLIGGNQI